VKEVRIDPRYGARGAIDVQLIDASTGVPIPEGCSIEINVRNGVRRIDVGPEGWLRLRGTPADYEVNARLGGGPREVLAVTIPLSGYAKTVWRLKTKP
jgi:hypothetical protein